MNCIINFYFYIYLIYLRKILKIFGTKQCPPMACSSIVERWNDDWKLVSIVGSSASSRLSSVGSVWLSVRSPTEAAPHLKCQCVVVSPLSSVLIHHCELRRLGLADFAHGCTVLWHCPVLPQLFLTALLQFLTCCSPHGTGIYSYYFLKSSKTVKIYE